MALFKVNRGPKANLPSTKTDGYAYFCTDDGSIIKTEMVFYKENKLTLEQLAAILYKLMYQLMPNLLIPHTVQ